jgi:hypothetical protein
MLAVVSAIKENPLGRPRSSRHRQQGTRPVVYIENLEQRLLDVHGYGAFSSSLKKAKLVNTSSAKCLKNLR